MIPVRYWLVVGSFLLSVLLYVDRVCISTAKAQVAGDLKLSDTEMGWVLSAFALGYALCQTPAGVLADRLGPRSILTAVVVFWSMFTGLTAAAWNLATMLVARFLFGAGEAGAFPGLARATYAWFPMQERGLVTGINFSGARIGAACTLPLMALAIERLGWRLSFVALMAIGFVWAAVWFLWFRNDPQEHPQVGQAELQHILKHRQQQTSGKQQPRVSLLQLALSANVWLICLQYFGSNFTFFFCLTWMHPYLKQTYQLDAVTAGVYAAVPFLCGAAGNWTAGWLVDRMYHAGRWTASRRVPAMAGFVLSAAGVLGMAYADTPLAAALWLSLAVFGADMTLAPSWSFCIDIGRASSGMVSGTMNMAGNIGSFVTGLAFPYLAAWTGSHMPFFYVAAGLSVLSAAVWMLVDPRRSLEASS
jgi:ACS family glucarate transporter-like MFS transporter